MKTRGRVIVEDRVLALHPTELGLTPHIWYPKLADTENTTRVTQNREVKVLHAQDISLAPTSAPQPLPTEQQYNNNTALMAPKDFQT